MPCVILLFTQVPECRVHHPRGSSPSSSGLPSSLLLHSFLLYPGDGLLGPPSPSTCRTASPWFCLLVEQKSYWLSVGRKTRTQDLGDFCCVLSECFRNSAPSLCRSCPDMGSLEKRAVAGSGGVGVCPTGDP